MLNLSISTSLIDCHFELDFFAMIPCKDICKTLFVCCHRLVSTGTTLGDTVRSIADSDSLKLRYQRTRVGKSGFCGSLLLDTIIYVFVITTITILV